MTHWRATSGTDLGGNEHPSRYSALTRADLNLRAGMLWALVVGGPAIIVLGTAFGYMFLAPLIGLPSVPAF